MDDTVAIPLLSKQGEVVAYTLIDAQDAPMVSEHAWRLFRIQSSALRYAYRYVKGRPVFLHRVLLGLPVHPGRSKDRIEVDHKNRDGLDNRRSNLRVGTHAENMQNMPIAPNKTSRYRNVYWHRDKGRWAIRASQGNRSLHLGYFSNEDEAGYAAARWRAEHMPFAVEARHRNHRSRHGGRTVHG